MTGKTHVAIGIAASLLVTQPSTLKELFICLGVAIVGSVISDIDVTTSESHQTLDWILGLILAVSVLLAFADIQVVARHLLRHPEPQLLLPDLFRDRHFLGYLHLRKGTTASVVSSFHTRTGLIEHGGLYSVAASGSLFRSCDGVAYCNRHAQPQAREAVLSASRRYPPRFVARAAS